MNQDLIMLPKKLILGNVIHSYGSDITAGFQRPGVIVIGVIGPKSHTVKKITRSSNSFFFNLICSRLFYSESQVQ